MSNPITELDFSNKKHRRERPTIFGVKEARLEKTFFD